MVYLNPVTLIDGYKADHRRQYPEGTQYVFSNLTARSDRLSNIPESERNGVVLFGLQYFVMDVLMSLWDEHFFNRPRSQVCQEYKRRMDGYLGVDFDVSHIEALHDLGYLPLRIRALKEGTVVPYRVPMLTVENTNEDFEWLTNYIETILSDYLWKPCTSATTAFYYRRIFEFFADVTGANRDALLFQAHDFSMRGMSGPQDAAMSGAGHLTCFLGTDTIPAIDLIEHYYPTPSGSELIGASVPATEHSVMCAGGEDGEAETFDRIAFDVYPSGIVSIVSDTWDFWSIMTEYLPSRKERILERDGKLVIRPDSGDPVKIICGDPDAPAGSPEHKGAIECLWDIFGGTVTSTGHRELDPHIGLIYGDSITPERAFLILSKLAEKGFASSNVVLGVGSFTYQHVTRDTHGFAMKATWAQVNDEGRMLFKDPKTDSGVKKSLRGKFSVVNDPDEGLIVMDQQHHTDGCLMDVVFEDGELRRLEDINSIRERIDNEVLRYRIKWNATQSDDLVAV